MAGLGWLWLVATIGCAIVIGAALYYGTRQTYRRAREMGVTPEAADSDPSALAKTEGYAGDIAFAGNKPNLPKRRIVP